MTTYADDHAEDTAVALNYEITSIVRQELDLGEVEAARLAEGIVRGLRKRFTGEYLGRYYLTDKLSLRERAHRDRAIRAEFNGRNRDELCEKYKISQRRLYQILGRQL